MRLRNQFSYFAAHTGRWGGRGVQPQNLPRTETDKEALKALLEGKPVSSLSALSSCVRPCIRAPKGYKLVVADLNAIEVRVLWWLAGCEKGLEIFRQGRCPYKTYAADFFEKDYESITKDERKDAKPPVLGCGYGLGGGMERELQSGQKVKTGLWKYAEGMGRNLPKHICHQMVNHYRTEYREVVDYWYYLEDAFYAAFKTRKRQQVGAIYFTATPEAIKVQLPSGRFLHYLNPGAWKGTEGLKLSFDGHRAGGWGRQSTWGGRITENIVQAVSRDVLAKGMKRADKYMTVVGHVHDEIICLEEEWGGWDKAPDKVGFLEQCMSAPIDWAPGLPLAAEGYESEFYMKQ